MTKIIGKISLNKLADKLASEVLAGGKAKRIKVRTLLKQFDFEKLLKTMQRKLLNFWQNEVFC
ncbi:MAG: hypothetical protein M3Q99_06405 [Acidobacteriota bacterium]|nr:hypothetical protein [Acidobacteriota bacterium]